MDPEPRQEQIPKDRWQDALAGTPLPGDSRSLIICFIALIVFFLGIFWYSWLHPPPPKKILSVNDLLPFQD